MSRQIESAVGIHLALCPTCKDVHLYFSDENGEDFAEAILAPELARRLLADLQFLAKQGVH